MEGFGEELDRKIGKRTEELGENWITYLYELKQAFSLTELQIASNGSLSVEIESKASSISWQSA